MKKYQDNDYALVVNRARLDDRGEYTVRAKNAYGSKEEVVFLNVQSKPGSLTSSLFLSIFHFRVTGERAAPKVRGTQAPEAQPNAGGLEGLGIGTPFYFPPAASAHSASSFVQADMLCCGKAHPHGKTCGIHLLW